MENICNLKKICLEKKDIVYDLYSKLANNTLEKDMESLAKKYTNLKSIKPDYYKENNFEYRISNGNLEIIDNRQFAFLWCFEIVLNSNIRIGDTFIFNKRLYIVSTLNDIVDNDISLQVEKVISEYDNTIQLLRSKDNFMDVTYYYECEHEDVKCSDIFEVYKTVNERKL
jgi:hypothetical protein